MKSSKKHWLKSALPAHSPSWTMAVVFVACCTVVGCQESEPTGSSKTGTEVAAEPAATSQEAPATGPATAPDSSPDRPNLLLVTLDTLRADRLGCYGYEPANTPVVDGLAARGVLFEQAFTPAPMTLPAHSTMMTGLLPPQHGARVNGEHRLGDGPSTLAEHLSAVGYRTGAFIAAFVLDGKFGLDRGFDYYGDDLTAAYEQEVPEALSSYRPGATVVDETLEWLESGDSAAPLFAWVHLYDVHYPWYAHGAVDGQDDPEGSYDGEVTYADEQVGRLLSALSQRGSLDNTVVMIVADHGEGLGDHHEIEHGYLLNEEVLHVPWIIAGPGAAAGERCQSVVSLEDLMPTALALLDVPLDSNAGSSEPLPGRSLLPALQGESLRSGISYAETDLPWTAYHWAPQRSLTTEDWKYINTPQAELYDRAVDRAELVNLVDVRPQITEKMRARLAALEDQLGETLSEAALLTADEAESLAALGYVGGSGGADSPAERTDLADVKERLAAKDLSANLRQREAAGELSVDERLEMFAQLVDLSPETPSFRSQLGKAWVDVGRTEDGLMQMAAAVELAPGSASLHYDLGDALQQYGFTAEARREFEATLALSPEMAAAHVGLGNVLRDEGRSDLAAGRYTEALRLRPGYAEAHFNLAQTFRDRGFPERAIEQFRLAIEHKPDWAHAHSVLAAVFLGYGRKEEAVAEYEATIALLPEEGSLHNDLGVVLLELGRYEAAREHYQRASDLAPGNFRPRINMANLALSLGDEVGAHAAFEQALGAAPDAAEPAARLARFLASCPEAELRDGPRAVSLAEHAVDLTGGEHARVLDTLGMAYAATGRFPDAISAAERGQKLAEQEGDSALFAEITERLALFAAEQPWVRPGLEAPEGENSEG